MSLYRMYTSFIFEMAAMTNNTADICAAQLTLPRYHCNIA